MKTLSILSLSLLLLTACQSSPDIKEELAPKVETQNQEGLIVIPKESQQLLMVVTPDWNAKVGSLQRYERTEAKWQKVGNSIDIILGRNGLGWGLGLHEIPKDAKYIKKEGDGRAPAGLFALGNGFGYSDFSINFPYHKYQRTDHCVDDSNSKWYNQIVDSTQVAKDYKSFEHMRLKNNLYEYGITVNHNPKQVSQAGSCIFMHIRNESGKGTAGCTAMKRSEIIEVLKWLQEDKKPLLLQLPKAVTMKKIHDDSLK